MSLKTPVTRGDFTFFVVAIIFLYLAVIEKTPFFSALGHSLGLGAAMLLYYSFKKA